MSDDKVVHAFPSLPENPLQIERKPVGTPLFCRHDAIRIEQHSRSISCATCDAALDPFDFLLTNARVIQQAWSSHKQVTDMLNELNERVFALKKEEKRLRAQVKRLQEKTGAVVSVRLP